MEKKNWLEWQKKIIFDEYTQPSLVKRGLTEKKRG